MIDIVGGERFHDEATDEDVLVERRVAQYLWGCESALTVVFGAHAVDLLPGGRVALHSWGDDGSEGRAVAAPHAPAQWAALVADWLVRCDGEVAAALAWERVGGLHGMSAGEREAWTERLDVVGLRVAVDEALVPLAELRRQLADRSARYRTTAAALADISSPRGWALAAAIDAAIEDGDLMGLVHAAWYELGRQPA